MYKCPKCGSKDLRVEVTAVVVLLQYGGEAEADLPVGGASFDWDHESLMLCARDECGYMGEAARFYQED